MRVLIVPDKFKGTLTAREAAGAIARGWRKARPQDALTRLPMSDGGEGFGTIVSRLVAAEPRQTTTVDAAGRRRKARWWWQPEKRLSIIESAEVVGLALLPRGKFHPFELDTTGLAKLLMRVAQHHPRQTLIGLGGSATNDGGFGMARALGWRFETGSGEEISNWSELKRCGRVVRPKTRPTLGRLTLATDVLNPLLGVRGCSRVFGPQKGLLENQIPEAEKALRTLSNRVPHSGRGPCERLPGAGAAGGLGFGLMSFLQGRSVTGFGIFSHYANLEQRIRDSDLVVTAEGCLDDQSLMGKGTGSVLEVCGQLHVPCIALAGTVRLSHRKAGRFLAAQSMDELTSRRRAAREADHWLAMAAAKVAALDTLPG